MQRSAMAIHVRNLNKQYGTMRALNDFSLDVPMEGVCGLLGPNGAGKTSAVRILSTLLSLHAVRILFGNPIWSSNQWMNDYAIWLALAWPLLLSAILIPLSARLYHRLGQ